MLTVIINYREDNIIGFTVKGHANYAPEGQDICCAGVSAVTQTALSGLISHLQVKPDYKINKGDLEVKLVFPLSREDNEKAQIILSTMLTGLKLMEESYGEFIRIEMWRCSNV